MAGGALDKAIQLKSVEELPEKQRSSLALLHLVEGKSFIPNVGFKESDTVYWVYSENVL
jgi:hypothetical protein